MTMFGSISRSLPEGGTEAKASGTTDKRGLSLAGFRRMDIYIYTAVHTSRIIACANKLFNATKACLLLSNQVVFVFRQRRATGVGVYGMKARVTSEAINRALPESVCNR